MEVLENLDHIVDFTTGLINYIIQLLPFNYPKFNESPIKAIKWWIKNITILWQSEKLKENSSRETHYEVPKPQEQIH